jgi:competence protein ComEC
VECWMDEEYRWNAGRMRPPRRRAMVGLAMPVMAGTAAGIAAPFSPLWFWGAGSLLLLPLFLWVRHRRSVWPLMAVLFCLVAAHARQFTGPRSALSLDSALVRPVEYVQVVAMALEDAVPRPARPGQAASVVFLARVEGLNRDGVWRRVEDSIRVVVRGDGAGRRLPRYGERWRLRGVVRPSVPRRSGLFTLPENQAVVDPDRAVFLDAGRGNPVKAWCMERRRAARDILARGLDDFPEERGLLQALLLGYREELPSLLRQDFAATGTVHIFAISGAHVGMVTMLLAGVLQALGVPRTRWFLWVAPLLAVYTIATGAATSAIRACVMASLLLAAPFLRRKPDTISTLAVAASAILLVAPGQLGDLGFLLSFTAVAGLLAVQPIFDVWALGTFRRDDWQLPREELPDGRRLREAGLAMTRFGSVSVSAWISTAPLTAFFFNLVSPVALAMNLVVIPAAFAILMSGVLSLLSAPLSLEVSEIFNHAARACAQVLAFLIRWAAAVPGGHAFVRTPPAAGVAVWYAVLAVAAVMARRVKGALPSGLALLAVLALAWGMREARRCRVSVLDVGEGNAVLVQAQLARFLIDTGPGFRAEGTLRQLRQQGVNRLDALVLTHSDAEHMGAASWLLRELPVGEVWVPSHLWPSPLMRAVLREAEATGIPIRRLSAGDSGDWPGDLFWEILWPPENLGMARADDASLVMRVARYGASILLTADAGGPQEKDLLGQGVPVAAPVLLAGRHGDAEASTAAWLDAVRPRDVLISSGPHVDGRLPDAELLQRLAERSIRLWRTDQQGAIHVELQGSGARWPDPGYRIHARP